MAVLSDLGSQPAVWEDSYVSAAGFEKYKRALAWAASEAGKNVATRMKEATAEVIDRPMPWIWRAWRYTRALSQDGDRALGAIQRASVSGFESQTQVLLTQARGPRASAGRGA
ncbi:hypothetical protein BHAOGJBA_0761 [Methylobacterium hispanicum]|uniref:Transposase IS204/IS1001/IS1096/IS1165 DDE domain-containing protein n=1 Tax=Methylobacterium hispanicum TaxID=270350 RepID=A0AAV4ZFR7_9HYPH|nr:hypothetical protein [Methylobacterium hispanicum]GJD87261.1 hypothetical protein BHAOGJBA_0761 [Methylobacterium hispanicum]